MQKENKDKIKIIITTTKSDLGGSSRYIIELIKEFPDKFIPYFIMNEKGYLSDELEKYGYKDNVYFIPMTNSIVDIPAHIKTIFQTIKLIYKIKPDLIHCNCTTAGIAGRISGFLTGVPVIFTAHGWAFTEGKSYKIRLFYMFLETFLAFLTKKIICVSEYDRQIALKVMPYLKNKIVIIHNGISDIEEIHRKKEFSKDKLKIVMVSRFCPQKDPYTLINAVKELNQEGLNIKLDLYGYGEELEQVCELINDAGDLNINYCSEISDVTLILKNYDIYILISNWEGLPIGIIEGLRAGLPILASNVGGIPELVHDGENGFLIERQNKDMLKDKIKTLYNKKELLSKFSDKSRMFYETQFNSSIFLNKTFNIYDEYTK